MSLTDSPGGGKSSGDDPGMAPGPLAGRPGDHAISLNVGTDRRKDFRVSPSLFYRRTELGEYLTNIGTTFRYRPHPAATLSIRPEWSRNFNTTQYVETVADPDASRTFGNRYVFADLNQTTLSASIRLDWTFTPDLSLQVYAQPFLSAGRFDRFKELARPESLDYQVYGEDKGTVDYREEDDRYRVDPNGDGTGAFNIGNPDFNIRSLRGNAVLRWEFRPGSTLYLVWQQTRESRGESGLFHAGRDYGELFRSSASHIFLVKFSYWFGV